MTANLIENLKLVAAMAVNSHDAPNALIVFEKYVIETQLRKRKWNQSDAAKALRMHRKHAGTEDG